MSGGMITADVSGKADTVLTSKGDLATWDTKRVRKGVSATNYTGLQADSAIADGLTYGATSRSTLTGTGSILYSSSANTLAQLSAGTGEYTLKMNSGGTAPEWVDVSAGGATVTEVTDRNTASKTTTSSTLVTADTNFSVTVPNITSGYCVVLANLCTQNSDSGATATSAIYDVTNTVVLSANTTSTSSAFCNTQVITTDADGKELQIYISAPAGNTCYLLGQAGTGTSLENTCNLNVLGIG